MLLDLSVRDNIRIVGFDESVQINDIVQVINKLDECEQHELRVSSIRLMRNVFI